VPGAPRKAYHDAERRFAVRVRIAVPQGGFGRQFSDMHAWLDDACGKAGWASAPAGLGGVANDAVAFYFDDAAIAQAFVNRFCCGYRLVEADRNVSPSFSLRSENPPSIARRWHKDALGSIDEFNMFCPGTSRDQ
jgi:hypothetical protein